MIGGVNKLKAAGIKAAIVLVPSYTAAFLTEKMVWVVPTLAAASFFAGTVEIGSAELKRRIDEDVEETDHSEQEDQEQDNELDELNAEYDGSE